MVGKKKVVFFTVALDEPHALEAQKMVKSLRRFHPTEDLVVFDKGSFDRMGGVIGDNDPIRNDLLRLTPFFARTLIKDYETVIRLDADQVILGDLNYLIDSEYDVGTVLNINRVDPSQYQTVQFQGIAPNEYYNCGLVAMRSETFINHWYNLCKSKYFPRLRYGEQDVLNILTHYCGYRTRCFDHYDDKGKYYAWHGLVAKGEGMRMKMQFSKGKWNVVLPPDKNNYPDRQLLIKAYHWAGGGFEKRWNYRVHFSDEVIHYIDWLLSDSKDEYHQ